MAHRVPRHQTDPLRLLVALNDLLLTCQCIQDGPRQHQRSAGSTHITVLTTGAVKAGNQCVSTAMLLETTTDDGSCRPNFELAMGSFVLRWLKDGGCAGSCGFGGNSIRVPADFYENGRLLLAAHQSAKFLLGCCCRLFCWISLCSSWRRSYVCTVGKGSWGGRGSRHFNPCLRH